MVALPIPHSATIDAIFAAYEESAAGEGERTYLGMSTFGNECDRALWYSFRWVSPPEKFSGRMLRLFKTGHREEARMLDDLRRVGVKVYELDAATGRQWALVGYKGHVRGHMDAQAIGLPEAPKTIHIVECKTHKAKSYQALITKGIAASKPGHYAQMQLYMHHSGAVRALYMAHNKDTDELHVERVNYDPVAAAQLVARGAGIVDAVLPPAKLHENPEHKMAFACRWCHYIDACHGKAFPVRRNCRTCAHVTPIENGGWHCRMDNALVDDTTQKQGCSRHIFIPELVPFQQIDVNDDCTAITYSKANGEIWVDGDRRSEAPNLPLGCDEPRTNDQATGVAVASERPNGDVCHAVKTLGLITFSDGVK